MSDQYWVKAARRRPTTNKSWSTGHTVSIGNASSLFGNVPPSTPQQNARIQKLMQQLGMPSAMWGQPTQKPKKPKLPRRRILCKVKMESEDDTLIIYREGTCRWKTSSADDYFYWKLAHSEFGPMFLYKDDDCTDDNGNPIDWHTDWKSNDKDEVRLAETIVRALGDIEMEKVLKGDKEYGPEEPTKTSDSPEERPEHAQGQDGLSGSSCELSSTAGRAE